MESIEVKLWLFTPQLGKAQTFYTALGMNWVGGSDPKDDAFRPCSPKDEIGLPFLMGELGPLKTVDRTVVTQLQTSRWQRQSPL